MDSILLRKSQGRVVSVAAGDAHSLCVTSMGEVFAWGSNKHGQLGVRPSDLSSSLGGVGCSTPKRVSDVWNNGASTTSKRMANIVQVSASYYSTLLIVQSAKKNTAFNSGIGYNSLSQGKGIVDNVTVGHGGGSSSCGWGNEWWRGQRGFKSGAGGGAGSVREGYLPRRNSSFCGTEDVCGEEVNDSGEGGGGGEGTRTYGEKEMGERRRSRSRRDLGLCGTEEDREGVRDAEGRDIDSGEENEVERERERGRWRRGRGSSLPPRTYMKCSNGGAGSALLQR